MADTELVESGDFEAIEAAVMETARGRWFLGEYLKRYRSADTSQVLQAIERLGSVMAIDPDPAEPAGAVGKTQLDQVTHAIGEARAKLVAVSLATDPAGESSDGRAWIELLSGEADTSGLLLEAAGEIQEIGRRYRATAGSGRAGDRLAKRAGDIYAACVSDEALRLRVTLVAELIDRVEQIVAGSRREPKDDRQPDATDAAVAVEVEEVGAQDSPDDEVVASQPRSVPVAMPEPRTGLAFQSEPGPRKSLEIDSGVIAFLGGLSEPPADAQSANGGQSPGRIDQPPASESIADPTEGMSAATIKALLW